MKNRRALLLTMYWLPIAIAAIRLILTVMVFIWNPMHLPLRFLQVIPLLVLGFSIFMYMKLYTDSDPIVTLIAPSIVHFLLIFAFRREIVLIPFAPLVFIDLVYLIVKGIKSTAFPFEVEGEEENMSELEELEEE